MVIEINPAWAEYEDNESQWTADEWYDGTNNQYFLYSRDMSASLEYSSGFTSICGNTNKIYLGTSGAGVKMLDKEGLVSYPDTVFPEILSPDVLQTYLMTPFIPSLQITYLHCSEDYLGVITPLGFATVKIGRDGYIASIAYPANYQAYKCFILSDGYLYFTLEGPSDWRIAKTNNPSSLVYDTTDIITDGSILPEGVELTDIYVTEGTAKDKIKNTIFCATTSGAYIIDESDSSYYSFIPESGDYTFNSIYADPNTSIRTNKVYIASDTCLYIIRMDSKSVTSRWTSAIAGVDGETISKKIDTGISLVTVGITAPIVDINKI